MKRRYARAAVMLGLPLVLSDCALVDLCNYETRSVSAFGRVTEGASELASATVDVSGTRGSQQERFLSWSIAAPSLSGEVAAIALIHANPAVLVRLPLPVQGQPGASPYAGSLTQFSGDLNPNLDGIFEIVEENQAVIEMTTIRSLNPVVRLPLAVTTKQDWYRANCS